MEKYQFGLKGLCASALLAACPGPGPQVNDTDGSSGTGTVTDTNNPPTSTPTTGPECEAPQLTDEQKDCSKTGVCPANHDCEAHMTCTWNGVCEDPNSTSGTDTEPLPTTTDEPTSTTSVDTDSTTGEPGWVCKDGQVIDLEDKCDYIYHCVDHSDEEDCDHGPGLICDDGTKMIPPWWVCDYDQDCKDESDEVDCPGFMCVNGEVIDPYTKCDYFLDCDDGSDEVDCDLPPPFMCTSGEQLPPSYKCDGEAECRDESDEANCSQNCGDGLCDMFEGCDDGNDIDGDGCENNCTPTAVPTCGNGKLEYGEACDDSNLQNGDGCEANCAFATCGNGVTDNGEECDDDNGQDGDGCHHCLFTPVFCTDGDGEPLLPNEPQASNMTRAFSLATTVKADRITLKQAKVKLPKFMRKLKKSEAKKAKTLGH